MKNKARVNISITGSDVDNLNSELNKIMNGLVRDGWKVTVEKSAQHDPVNNVCYAGCIATKG